MKVGIRELTKQARRMVPDDPRRKKIERVIERKRKKRDRPSPTKLAKDTLTAMGATFDVVEQRLPGCFITRDYLNCIDLIACSPSLGIVGIQVTGDTDGGNHAKRCTKIDAEPRAVVWMKSGGRLEVWSYSLRGAVGVEKDWKLRRSRAFLVGERIGWTEVGEP